MEHKPLAEFQTLAHPENMANSTRAPPQGQKGERMTSPHVSWLKHGADAKTALVGSIVIGRVALEGDLWTWHASLPHGDLLADHGLRNRATSKRTSGSFPGAVAGTLPTPDTSDLCIRQSNVKEWLELMQERLRKNAEGMSKLAQCRTLPDFAAFQSDLARENLNQIIDFARRIAERSMHVAEEAAKRITAETGKAGGRFSRLRGPRGEPQV